jgi:hypothetical protein
VEIGSDNKSSPSSSLHKTEKLPKDEVEQRRRKLLNEINRIDNWTSDAADNGLFEWLDKKHRKAEDKQGVLKEDAFERIQRNLKKARQTLYEEDFSDAEYFTSLALHSYDKALYGASRLWRFSNMYAGPIWIYLIGFLIGVLSFYIYFIDAYFVNFHGIQQAAIHAVTWGCIGGILRGMWYLKDKVSDRRYRNSWRIYFLSVPFLGGIFGSIVYLVIVAGLAALNVPTGPPSDGGQPLTIANPIAIIPLAALAGFNWEWAVILFKRIGDTIVKDECQTEKENKIEK